MPATGQPVMLRRMSPQAPAVVRPCCRSRSKTAGTSGNRIQWSWMFWRVEISPLFWPNRREISPITRSCWGVTMPPGIFTRIMKVPTLGLS